MRFLVGVCSNFVGYWQSAGGPVVGYLRLLFGGMIGEYCCKIAELLAVLIPFVMVMSPATKSTVI